ncbi:hypothetical protein EDB80DRAFT_520178, partial [Ilyonectria destructans]
MEYFTFLPDFQLLRCRSCAIRLVGCKIAPHLRAIPHQLTKNEIKHAEQWASSLGVIPDYKQLCDLAIPPDDSMPFEGLGDVFTGGLRCTLVEGCPYVGSTLRRIWEHFKKEHGLRQERKGGRRSASQAREEQENMPCRSGVLYQQFFHKGP